MLCRSFVTSAFARSPSYELRRDRPRWRFSRSHSPPAGRALRMRATGSVAASGARRWSPSTARARCSRSAKPSRRNFRKPTRTPRDRGYLRHRRRLSEILPRRDRHRRRLTADQRHRSRRLRQDRHPVHRAADRLRRHRHRREPQEHLGRQDHGGRAEDAVGSGRAGQGHARGTRSARTGRIARSTCSAPASTRAPTTTSPKRSTARPRPAAATSPRAKTTTCWCRASATTSSRSASCRSPTSKRTAPS